MMLTSEQLAQMEEKAMMSLYNAIMSDKITTVQGMCQVIGAISDYHDMHHVKNGEAQEEDLL